jgi:hypothetical protein
MVKFDRKEDFMQVVKRHFAAAAIIVLLGGDSRSGTPCWHLMKWILQTPRRS